MARNNSGLSDANLSILTGQFLKEYAFDVSQTEFLNPFFDMGILYSANGTILFTHPYLESYLLAEALREDTDFARQYFSPGRPAFNFYAFDLYCELGPDPEVISTVANFSLGVLSVADKAYPEPHVYIQKSKELIALSNPKQLTGLTDGLMSAAKKLNRKETNDNIRAEKQRILDAKQYVRSEVVSRAPDQAEYISPAAREELEILDQLSRALALTTTSIGSGSEALDATSKLKLANLVLNIGARFSDIWTRNRLRLDFDNVRAEILSEAAIWQYLDETGIDRSEFNTVKSALELFLHGAELNAMVEPMGRILWRISAASGVPVLAPILKELTPRDPIERVIRGSWYMDVDPKQGRDVLKSALSDYKGSPLLRIVLASHLLWRVFWHHYKTVGSSYFLNSARRALAPVGLAVAPKRLEQVSRGPHSHKD